MNFYTNDNQVGIACKNCTFLNELDARMCQVC